MSRRARVVALLALEAAGCGRIWFDPLGSSGTVGDGGNGDAGDSGVDATSCTAFGPWGTPQRIAELASAVGEFGDQIQADGLTMYFDRHSTGSDVLYVASRPDRTSPFGTAQPLSALGTNASEGSASSPGDQLEIFFESARSGTVCIYRATRSDASAAWGAPAQVAALCGSPTEGPYVTPDGLTLLYNTASPPTNAGTLMIATRASRMSAFPAGSPAPGLAGGITKGYPVLAPDELTVYFESGSPTDLYQAQRASTAMPFGAPVPIPGINTTSIEQDVSISPDGLELFFASNRPGSAGLDLYTATRSCTAGP